MHVGGTAGPQGTPILPSPGLALSKHSHRRAAGCAIHLGATSAMRAMCVGVVLDCFDRYIIQGSQRRTKIAGVCRPFGSPARRIMEFD